MRKTFATIAKTFSFGFSFCIRSAPVCLCTSAKAWSTDQATQSADKGNELFSQEKVTNLLKTQNGKWSAPQGKGTKHTADLDFIGAVHDSTGEVAGGVYDHIRVNIAGDAAHIA